MEVAKSGMVSILVPVRNGEDGLETALESVLGQTYQNLEIVVSNNHSSDSTAEIIDRYKKKDSRIRTLKPEQLLSAADHFFWVADQASGEFSCWVAHDDDRPPNFVEALVEGLESTPGAVLAFGDVEMIEVDGTVSPVPFPFETVGRSHWSRVRQTAFLQCFNMYGLWRLDVIRNLPRNFCDWWTDMPIMTSAAIKGEFCRVPDVVFTYRDSGRSAAEKSEYHTLRKMDRSRFPKMYRLLRDTFLSTREVGGAGVAVWATWCVLERHLRVLPGWSVAKVRGTSVDSR